MPTAHVRFFTLVLAYETERNEKLMRMNVEERQELVDFSFPAKFKLCLIFSLSLFSSKEGAQNQFHMQFGEKYEFLYFYFTVP
jgi:hypothetical protein